MLAICIENFGSYFNRFVGISIDQFFLISLAL